MLLHYASAILYHILYITPSYFLNKLNPPIHSSFPIFAILFHALPYIFYLNLFFCTFHPSLYLFYFFFPVLSIFLHFILNFLRFLSLHIFLFLYLLTSFQNPIKSYLPSSYVHLSLHFAFLLSKGPFLLYFLLPMFLFLLFS